MGELILFRPQSGRMTAINGPPQSGAQIMFFTGVRYERMAEAQTSASDGGAEPTPKESVGKSGRGRKRRRG
jgi:hypothetical protein